MFDTELIQSITIGAAATIPIVVAIVQVFKMTGWIKDKYAPFVAIGAGIIVSFLMAHDTNDMSANVLSGILFGLAASGLYSGIKTSAHAIQMDRVKQQQQEQKQKDEKEKAKYGNKNNC
jgi:hypothetical protein